MATTTKPDNVGITELAAKIGAPPTRVRAFIRGLDAELSVGRGGRYRWDSLNDAAPKRIAREWAKANAAKKEA